MENTNTPLLSICISTLNRAALLDETLASVVSQVDDDCEIVVQDVASKDNTADVVAPYLKTCRQLRYVRRDKNHGFDEDFDKAVELARGQYCLLMSDDDVLKPGALSAVLSALAEGQDWSVVLMNSELRNFGMSEVIMPRWHAVTADKRYEPHDAEHLFLDVIDRLVYRGGVVIKRSLWLARSRESYYGSMFIYIGIIFQRPLPGPVLLIAKPLVACRFGNSHEWDFDRNVFEIATIRWPRLLWSLDVPERAKRSACRPDMWRDPRQLLFWRAAGGYSLSQFQRCVRPRITRLSEALLPALVAVFPGALINLFYMLLYLAKRRDLAFHILRESRYHPRNWFSRRPRSAIACH